MIKPKTKAPKLALELINDTRWELEVQKPDTYTMIVFYRGLHCPVCKKYLKELTSKLDKFTDRGVNAIAVSMDSEKRAKKAGEEWETGDLPIGYDMSRETAEEWGLFISESIKDEEPDIFSEPALFLIDKEGKVFYTSIQSMPFARPQFDDIAKAIDFVQEKNYPARGAA
ncbi:MAG: peroxiredoxin-like family protein [Leeuwenhoekiella sp.]